MTDVRGEINCKLTIEVFDAESIEHAMELIHARIVSIEEAAEGIAHLEFNDEWTTLGGTSMPLCRIYGRSF